MQKNFFKWILAASLAISAIGCGKLTFQNGLATSESLQEFMAKKIPMIAAPPSEAIIEVPENRGTTNPKAIDLSNPNQRCGDVPYGVGGPRFETIVNDLNSDLTLLARAIYGESDPAVSTSNGYITEKIGVGAAVLSRLALVNKLIWMVDDSGYRVDPKYLGFVPRNAAYGRLRVRDVVLHNPKSNFNVFEEGGGGKMIPFVESQIKTALNSPVGGSCDGMDYVSGQTVRMNCECLNLVTSVQAASSLATEYNRGFLVDPYTDKGITLAFNSNNTNPGGYLVFFAKATKTSFYGLPKRLVSFSPNPPSIPKGQFNKIGKVKPKQLVNAGSYELDIAPGGFATLKGEGLKEGSPVSTQYDSSRGQFPTDVDGTSVLLNGNEAELTYASSEQINFLIPESLATGEIEVVVRSRDGFSSATFDLVSLAPALFSADYSGAGWFNGFYSVGEGLNTIIPDTPTAQYSGFWNGVSVPASSGNRRTYLTLYGTGFNRSTAAIASVKLVHLASGRSFDGDVRFASKQPTYKGLSQLNFILPLDMPTGTYSVQLFTAGRPSNVVNMNIQGQ